MLAALPLCRNRWINLVVFGTMGAGGCEADRLTCDHPARNEAGDGAARPHREPDSCGAGHHPRDRAQRPRVPHHRAEDSGAHSKGSLIHDNATDIFIYGNLYASSVDRNPLFKGGARGAIANNFVTNPGSKAASYVLVASEWGSEPYQNGTMSILSNVFHHGPNTASDAPLLRIDGDGEVEVFLDDNVAEDTSGNTVDMVRDSNNSMIPMSSRPRLAPGFVAQASSSMLGALEHDVGARPWDRDD